MLGQLVEEEQTMASHRSPADRRLIGALLRVPYLSVVTTVYAGLVTAGYDDLRPAHLAVFQHIDVESGSRPTDLADKALMTKQSMGYLVDYLEEHGYVVRAPDPVDGRARLVRLTDRGMAVTRVAQQIVQGIELEWAGVLGKRRMADLQQTLQELVVHLEAALPMTGASVDVTS
jgi:DNA-binding MarR family transcriptional regulator